MYEIKNDFEGANIRVLSFEKDRARIEVEQRDTTEDWFFWCFKAVGANGTTVTFEFPSDSRVGYFGAAVSHDYEHWNWQYNDGDHSGNSFTYTFGADETEVYFAHDFCYRPQRLSDFAARRGLEIKTLCSSEKGRDVPFIDTESGDEIILLTARHHACESTGSYVLEGVLDGILNDEFFEKYRVICVPEVDFDGVTDGDQGKCRAPHDHNRDYHPNLSAHYNSVREIRKIADGGKLKFAFDFHSPWHLSGMNDTVFVPIDDYELVDDIGRFSELFERQNSADALPFYSSDNLMPDSVDWNKSAPPDFSYYMGSSGGAELSFTLETPYFKAHDVVFSAERAYNTGRNFARALKKYSEGNYD